VQIIWEILFWGHQRKVVVMKRIFKLLTLSIILFHSYAANAESEFTWENMLIMSGKLDKTFPHKKAAKCYMETFYGEDFLKYKSDEFEFPDKLKSMIPLMQKHFSNLKSDEIFIIRTSMKIDKYDFDKQWFPISGLNKNSYYKVDGSKCYRNNDPDPGIHTAFKIYFNNPEIVKNIKMKKEKAKVFIKKRKKDYGYEISIDRTVYVNIFFKITGFKKGDRSERGYGLFNANITEVLIFDDDHEKFLIAKYN